VAIVNPVLSASVRLLPATKDGIDQVPFGLVQVSVDGLQSKYKLAVNAPASLSPAFFITAPTLCVAFVSKVEGVAVTLVTCKFGLLDTQVIELTVATGQDTAGDFPSVTESPI